MQIANQKIGKKDINHKKIIINTMVINHKKLQKIYKKVNLTNK